MFKITRQSIHRQSRVWPYRKNTKKKCGQPMDSLCNIYLPSLQCFDTILNMFWACLGVYVGYNSWMYIYIYDKEYIDILREFSWYMINMCVYHTCRYIWFVSIYTHACGWSKNIWIYIKYIELLMMPIGPTSLGPKLCVKTCPFCGRIYLYVFFVPDTIKSEGNRRIRCRLKKTFLIGSDRGCKRISKLDIHGVWITRLFIASKIINLSKVDEVLAEKTDMVFLNRL